MSELVINQMDPNGRLNPVLENVKVAEDNNTQKIVDIAVPFLNLYQPTALATNTVLTAFKTVQIIKSLRHQPNKTAVCNQVKQLALTVGTLALSILMPAVGIAVSQCYSVCVQVDRLYKAIGKSDIKEIAESLANISLSALYTASVITAAPEVVVISILAQAAFELYQASGEFRKGRKNFLQGMAKVAMAAIRISQAAPMIKDLHQDYFGKQITQVDLDRYMAQVREKRQSQNDDSEERITSNITHRGSEGNLSLEDFVNANGYSRKISNLSFWGDYAESESYKKFRFYNCEFSSMLFNECTFTNVKFDKCTFDETCFLNCTLNNTSFLNSLFQSNSNFFGSSLSHVTFNNCDLTDVSFNETELYKSTFEKSSMSEASFLGAAVKGCKIRDSDLTDTLFCGTESHFSIKGGVAPKITKPVIAILWDHSQPAAYASYGNVGLKKCNAITLKVDYRLRDISQSKLQSQVDACLVKIAQKDRASYLSIADEVLNMAGFKTEIARIQRRAIEALKYSEGAYLPGGPDIAEQFYDPNTTEIDKTDYARFILEASMLKGVFKDGKPLLAACRGTQAINVYRGGTLHKSVENHSGVSHEFILNENAPGQIRNLIKSLIGSEFKGVSMHHQGCDQIGDGLVVALRASEDGLAECIISNDGNIIGTQFHPEVWFAIPPEFFNEYREYANGINFFTWFINSVKQYRENQMDVA